MEALDITETRQLEDLCINTIYSSLLTGKLSPQTQTFEISSVTSRDLPPSHDYTGMISTLSQWSKQCDLVLAEISGRIRDVRTEEQLRKIEEETYEKQLEKARNPSEEGEKNTGMAKGKGKERSPYRARDEREMVGGWRGAEDMMAEDAWDSNPVRRKRKSPGGP